jgi:hypothetical protein
VTIPIHNTINGNRTSENNLLNPELRSRFNGVVSAHYVGAEEFIIGTMRIRGTAAKWTSTSGTRVGEGIGGMWKKGEERALKTWLPIVMSILIVCTAGLARGVMSRLRTSWPAARREEITCRPTTPEPPAKAIRFPVDEGFVGSGMVIVEICVVRVVWGKRWCRSVRGRGALG